MSINNLRDSLKDIPGAHGMTMQYRYIHGEAYELFKIGDREELIRSPATPEKIREAFTFARLLDRSVP